MRKYLFAETGIQLICCILLNYQTEVTGSENSARIVNGAAINIRSAKFVVNLRYSGQFICGGALVAPQIVVTAAHCVKNVHPIQLTVVGGATYLSEMGVRRSVSKIIIPKEYSPKSYHTDVALLKLSAGMSGENVATIELCRGSWKLGDFIDVYGWGSTSENNNRESNQLRTVRVPLVTRKRCTDMYRVDGSSITGTMFCAGDLNGKDACFGDSGGPAIFQNQLCGIVSWGVGCARQNFPGVYTSIKSVRNFIDRAMKL